MLKIGLVGVGGISGAHIPAWNAMEDTTLTAICDIRPERMEPYPEPHHYTSIDEMLEKEELDILDICLPTYLHVPTAVKAMKKGIHVLSEKPISLKEEDIELAYSTAKENNVCFMIAQVLRFWPEYELIKELYDSGKYGKLLSGYMGRLGSYPAWSWDNWMMDEKRSGLVPYDLHIHDLDFLVYAFGKPEASLKHRAKQPNQDYLTAVYEFPGFFVTTEASWYASAYPLALPTASSSRALSLPTKMASAKSMKTTAASIPRLSRPPAIPAPSTCPRATPTQKRSSTSKTASSPASSRIR